MRRAIIIAGLLVAACTRPEAAERVLRQQGYTEIEITGYAWFDCSDKSDDFATGFRAKAPNGETVTGAVCEGLLKGKTVRLD